MDSKKRELLSIVDEYSEMPIEKSVEFSSYTKYPIASMLAIGSAVGTSLQTAVNGITTNTTFSTLANTSGMYRCVFPDGVVGQLAQAKDGSGYLGTIMNRGIQGQARWIPVDQVENVTQVTSQATVPFNPTMIFMAIALMDIEKRLGEIQSMQKEMMEFMEEDKEARQKGNLKTLSELISNYKFNWDNEKYKETQRVLTSVIKKEANQDVIFYKTRATKYLEKKNLIQTNGSLDKLSKQLQRDLKNYQLALYIYSFASFVEVMLLENFRTTYINSIISKISSMSFEYRTTYTEIYNKLELEMNSAIGTHVLGGISTVSKNVGKMINKIPIVEKGQVDEVLIAAGNKLGNVTNDKIDGTLGRVRDSKYEVTRVFVESLKRIEALYNQPMEILVDKDDVYMKLFAIE